jgi:YD repeat-containing protein
MNNRHDQNGSTKTEPIRHINGKPIATIKTDAKSGVQRGYDNLGNYAGKFDPRNNTTYDKQGRPVAKGNGLVGVVTNTICSKGMGAVCHPVAVIQSAYRPQVARRSFQVVPGSSYPRGPWRRW